MNRSSTSEARRSKRRKRIRARVVGSTGRPRLSVFKSLKHIYAQAIDDSTGLTVAHASSQDEDFRKQLKTGGNMAAARVVGALIANRLKEKGLEQAVFDRGGYPFHGRIKAVAEAAREAGLKL